MIIEMRSEYFTDGLIDLIIYINSFSTTKNMEMIEIGCYSGESTVIFSDYFKNVITIDPLEANYDTKDSASQSDYRFVYEIFQQRTRTRNNIQLMKNKSDDAYNILKSMDKKVDFVYIDGMHTYEQVKKDIQNYKNLINESGFIGGHDYNDGWKEVKSAVNETLINVDKIFKDTSWIKKL